MAVDPRHRSRRITARSFDLSTQSHTRVPEVPTRTDRRRAPIWLEHDPVIRLREWASDNVYALAADGAEQIIGRAQSADVQLVDPRGYISRRHASVVRDGGHPRITDLDSKNGIKIDDVVTDTGMLHPGAELRIGSMRLLAENRTMVALRAYLARVLGWEDSRRSAIDDALRAIRLAAGGSALLTLGGTDDLVAVARQIHLRSMPARAPFVLLGRRIKSDVFLRATTICRAPEKARELARGGTICVRGAPFPPGFLAVAGSKGPAPSAQLIVCTQDMACTLCVHPLARRSPEDRVRIVMEYAAEAIHELGARPESFPQRDLAWVTANAESFVDVETSTLRIVALRHAGTPHGAAPLLGLSHVAAGKWYRARGIR